ncbi:scale keratin-like [Hirundo rustica]|uniref:scale keratin-like n=1 Tax=Hirundo rustica TaxID=43150 RepID=UPI001A95041E|nr:scale keratin-like [Hirundo rustica]
MSETHNTLQGSSSPSKPSPVPKFLGAVPAIRDLTWQEGQDGLGSGRTSADLCPPRTSVAVPQPIAESCNELCARQCPDSSAFIQPPPVVVTFPGPILSSFPQQAVVGSSGAPAFGGSLGLGGLYGAGATQASGGLCTFGRAYAAPACSPCALPRYSKKLWDTCGPC